MLGMFAVLRTASEEEADLEQASQKAKQAAEEATKEAEKKREEAERRREADLEQASQKAKQAAEEATKEAEKKREEAERRREAVEKFKERLATTLPTPKFDTTGLPMWFRDSMGRDLIRAGGDRYMDIRMEDEYGKDKYDLKARFIEVLPTFPTARDRSYVTDPNRSEGRLYPEQKLLEIDGQPPATTHWSEWNNEHEFGMPPFYDKYYRGYNNAFNGDEKGDIPLYKHIKHILKTDAGCSDAVESPLEDETCWVVDGANLFYTNADGKDHNRKFAQWSVKTCENGVDRETAYDYPQHAQFVEWKRDRIKQTGRTGPFGPVIVVIKEQSYKNLQYDHSFSAYGQPAASWSQTQPTAPDQRPYLIASLAPLHAYKHPVIFVVAEAVSAAERDRAGSLTQWKLHQENFGDKKKCQWQGGPDAATSLDHMWCEFDDFVAYSIVSALGEKQYQIFTREGGDREECSESLRGSYKGIADYKRTNPRGYEDTLRTVRGAFRLRVFGLNTNYVRAYSQMGFHSTVSWFKRQLEPGDDYGKPLDELKQILGPLGEWAQKAFDYTFPTKSQRVCFDQIKAIGEKDETPHSQKVRRFVEKAQLMYEALLGMQTSASAPRSRRTAAGSWR